MDGFDKFASLAPTELGKQENLTFYNFFLYDFSTLYSLQIKALNFSSELRQANLCLRTLRHDKF